MWIINHKNRKYKLRTGVKKVNRLKTLSSSTLSVFISVVIIANLAGALVVKTVIDYQDKQRRILHALSDTGPALPQAVDSPYYKNDYKSVTKLPQHVQDQLKADKEKHEKGVPKDDRRVKTLDENRSETTKAYLNADGSKTVVYSADTTSFKDNQGKWQDVDTTLVKDSSGKWKTKANAWEASFGNSEEGVSITKGSTALTMKAVGANKVQPKITGSGSQQKVVYSDLWDNVDVVYELKGSYLKEDIILKNKNALPEFTFQLSGSSLQPKGDSLELGGDLTGFSIPSPTVRVKNGRTLRDSSIVTQTLLGNELKINLSKAWFDARPASAFPITIDPPIFSGSNAFTANNQTAPCLASPACPSIIGHDGLYGTGDYRFGYQVNVPSPPSSTDYLVSAVLHLEMASSPEGITSSENVSITRSSCSASNASFNCVDGLYGQATGTVTTSGNIEVGDLYRKAVINSENSPWFMVTGEEGGSVDKYKELDYTKTSVTFTYEKLPTQSTIYTSTSTSPITVPTDGGVTVTTQPTLASMTATDPDGPAPLRYRYIVGTGKSIPSANPLGIIPSITGIMADSGILDQPQWVVPDSTLQDGNTYYWQALVADSYNTSPIPYVHSPVYSFKVDLRNGKDSTQAFDSMGPVSVDFATGNITTSNSSHTMNSLSGSMGIGLDYNSPQRSRAGLSGEYWNDPGATRTFSSTTLPDLKRVDPNVDFNWGVNGPSYGVVSTDNFLGRFSGYFIAPLTATYQFGTSSDDRSRIFINGSSTAYVDGWSSNPTNTFGANVALTAGQVIKIVYEFAEITGNASVQLFVKTTDGAITQRVIPTQWLQTGARPIATPHGLVGKYYTDDGSHTFPSDLGDPTRLFLSRTDAAMAHNWGGEAPVPNGPKDNFMVRWTGYFTAPADDTYRFGAASDDGVKITIGTTPTPTTVVNAWSDHTSSPIIYDPTAGVVLTKGTNYPITIEYYEHTGSAQMSLYVKQARFPQAPDILVDSDWLTPRAQILPDGWNLGIDADGNLSYDYAAINQAGVTLYDSSGETHEYKFANGGFTPPVNEAGQMVRNGDGTVTLQDVDGRTYVFNSDGTIKKVTQAVDDRSPAALQYTYGSSAGSSGILTQIADGVNAARTVNVLYSGNSSCPVAPVDFLSSTPGNMICAVTSTDGNMTKFFYKNDTDGVARLGRIEKPGAEITDYTYTTGGMMTKVRDSLASDAVVAVPAVRVQNESVLTLIGYDLLGRANSISLPEATAGATRISHTYDYLPLTSTGVTQMHVTNAVEPTGFTRKVKYDGTFRTLEDTDSANQMTATVWDGTKDLVKSSTDPAGLKTTHIYDYADRETDTYGPAPSAWYGANNIPLTTPTNYMPQVPHSQKGYDENINGLAAAFYNVSTAANGTGANTKLLFGAPKSHGTGINGTNGDILKTWNGTPPFTPDNGYGWGTSLTGDIRLTAAGNHNFRVFSDDGVRVWIDDILVVNDWNDGPQRSHTGTTFDNTSNPADSWHRIRVDYYNKSGDSDARLELYMTPPGGSETSSLGSLLKPHYGLVTTSKTFDSSTSVGDQVTTNNYGSNPELGLVQSSSLDPAGLNLTTNYTYEAQGLSGGFLRQLSKALPGGETTNYAYYTATDIADNPCTTGTTEAYKQAGQLKIKTDPDPDGAGAQTPITTEMRYDDTGRVVASKVNSDPWNCMTYDSRSRLTQRVIPANANGSARTINYNYAVGTNPLVSSVVQGTESVSITTKTDLLGRVTSYQDRNNTSSTPTITSYDSIGRMISQSGKKGLEEYVYDNFNRLTNQKLNGIVLATSTYDSFGRLQQVTYPRANQQKLILSRDSIGRVSSRDFTLGNGSTHQIDSTTFSQSGQAVSGVELTKAKSYSYDKASRLTSATIGTNTYAYSYSAPNPAVCNQASANLNAHKGSNRTSQAINGVTTTYCYDNADRLISTSDTGLTSPTYDSHGNTDSLGQTANANYLAFDYDSSDRTKSIHQIYSQDYIVQYLYDAQDRVQARLESKGTTSQWQSFYGFTNSDSAPDYEMDNAWVVRERYMKLAGGVMLTIRSSASSFSSTSNVYSLSNIHGDTMATSNGAGALINVFTYEPFGKIIGTTLPDNTNGKGDFDYLGEHQKQTETIFNNQPQVMGARIYMSVLGRFTSVDPVDGGTANNYVYPNDPVNNFDLTGKFSLPLSNLSGSINSVNGACGLTGYRCKAETSATMAAAGVSAIGVGAGIRSLLTARYSSHALRQMAGRDGGRGVAASAIRYTLKYGVSLGPKVDSARRWSWVYESDRATVVVNSAGKIITAWAKSSKYWR